jgi:hypothetical protein
LAGAASWEAHSTYAQETLVDTVHLKFCSQAARVIKRHTEKTKAAQKPTSAFVLFFSKRSHLPKTDLIGKLCDGRLDRLLLLILVCICNLKMIEGDCCLLDG